MKNLLFILTIIACSCIAYWYGKDMTARELGYESDAKSKIENQANGILAYQHYYECAEDLLKDVEIDNKSGIGKDLALAKKELEDYRNNVIMEWPVICDQRDKLSDAIRKFSDDHPWFSGHEDQDIMSYVTDAGLNPKDLSSWAYAY